MSQTTEHESSLFLTEAQLRAELEKCEYCQEKPCLEACPAHCSPTDFIKAVEVGLKSDYQRAAALIMGKNPLGGICGQVCPDFHCMEACVHTKLDGAVEIPQVQATIIQRAKELGVMPKFAAPEPSGKKVAVIGGGPAGLAAAGAMAQAGHAVTLLERDKNLGGMCRCIPDFRLEKSVLDSDIEWLLGLGNIEVKLGHAVDDVEALLADNDAVVMAAGLWKPILPGVPGEELCLDAPSLLLDPAGHDFTGKTVAVIGGGATAYDCAVTAMRRGAARVEMLCLETLAEMPLTEKEARDLWESGVDVTGRVRVTDIKGADGLITGIELEKVSLAAGAEEFTLGGIQAVDGSGYSRGDVEVVILAIGLRPDMPKVDNPRVIYAGDVIEGPTTAVEASASGKNAAQAVEALFAGEQAPAYPRSPAGKVKGKLQIPGYDFRPVSLKTDFFGRPIINPFLLSAAPPSDGYDQVKLAYEAGWAGAIFKTAFDGIPIHIPGEYMFAYDQHTYANCDNVSGHALSRVCKEIEKLASEYPDRLTIGSTGGPVTGDDAADAAGWQHNTRLLESAGAMGIEYSLSCPQGGDGTEGDIVSQNAALTAKIIDWILSEGSGDVPKLFKLTGAVTSIAAIVMAVKEVLEKHPDKPAGITLANSFPTLGFRPGSKPGWEEGVVVGASGAGILNISYLSLASVAHLGVHISGNGGPMDYKAAADFLALGVRTVQFCTLVMKYGYDVIDDLCAGVSHLMADRGMASMDDLIGAALPGPVTDFMDLTPTKKISQTDPALCLHCGNCTRCPYLALEKVEGSSPSTDPGKCIGCSICSKKCFADAITMRERTPEELSQLKED